MWVIVTIMYILHTIFCLLFCQSYQFFPDLCGTPGYLSPEVLRCNMYENEAGYGKEVDM